MASTTGEFIRAAGLDDPERCQGNEVGRGRCLYKAQNGTTHCPRHQYHERVPTAKKERNYALKLFREKVNAFADNPEIKSLREEIGLVRTMIEIIWNECRDEHELQMRSGKLAGLIQQAQKLIESTHRLEERTGVLLDKQTIIVIADSMLGIVTKFVTDPEAVECIANELADVFAKTGGLHVTNNATVVQG